MVKSISRKFRLYMIIIVMCLGIIGCASKTPLPQNLTFVDPSPSLPPALSSFYGIWKGRWEGLQDSLLIVERISEENADIVLSLGDQNAAGGGINPPNVYLHVRADVINDSSIGWSELNNNKFIFKMDKGLNKIKGYFFVPSTGTKIDSDFYRVETSDLADVKVHRYPYAEYFHNTKTDKDFLHDEKQCKTQAENNTKMQSHGVRSTHFTNLSK